MPLPTPNNNESESDFIGRCMADDVVKNDFADEKQRLAVCYRQLRGAKGTLGKLQYSVKAQAIERDGKKYALIEVIDESECKNKWRINPAGKARALAGILETPLLGPPRLGHEAIDSIGHPVDFTSNHSTRVLYEIKNPDDWEHIRSGEWGPVSPQLSFLKDHYEGDTQVIDEWRFDHVAFAEKGAFPNAGVKNTCEGDPALCGFSKAVTAAFDGHGLEPSGSKPRQNVAGYSNNRQPDREKTRGHPTGGVIVKNTGKKEVNTMSCEHDKVIAELTDKNNTLDAEVKELKAASNEALEERGRILEAAVNELTIAPMSADFAGKVKTLEAELAKAEKDPKLAEKIKKLQGKLADIKAKNASQPDAMATVQAELKVVKAENESFKAWKQAREDADHMERVQAVLDLRVKAGVLEMKDVAAAIEPFKKLDNEALDLIAADLTKVHGKFESLPSGPKAKLIPSSIVGARFNPTMETVGSLIGVPVGQVRAAEQPRVKA